MKALKWALVVAIIGLFSNLNAQTVSSSNITFKNEHTKAIYVAIAFKDNNPYTMGGMAMWTKFWFKCEPGKSIVLTYPTAYGDKYFHAHVAGDKSTSWGSQEKYYVHPSKGYSIMQGSVPGVDKSKLIAKDLSGKEIQISTTGLDQSGFDKVTSSTVVIK